MTTTGAPGPRLARSSGAGPARRPVRIAHLGLGSFSRAHLAWYTEHAPDSDDWGIAAFTGRRPDLADALAPQDGLYTLVVRGAEADSFEVVSSLSAVHAAAEHAAWLGRARSPGLAVVTLTVTEAGYRRAGDGSLDLGDPEVARDVEALRHDPTAPVTTVPARLLGGLLARHRAGREPVAVVPCDNLPDNGGVAARVVRDAARAVDPAHLPVVGQMASFVTTMVDRITPEATAADADLVARATGRSDAAPVVTESFSEWVISGRFPVGRPAWDRAGALVVDDVVPFEQRKLWLLNGAHSLLAYAGSVRGHLTVADAIADPVCRTWVEDWWDEAGRYLPLPADTVTSYRQALAERFSNRRIRHLLAQIAVDGSQKLPVRVLPALRAARADDRPATASARVLAAWVCHLRGRGAPVQDARADAARAAAAGTVAEAVRGVLALLDPELAADPGLRDTMAAEVSRLEA
ncbi:MAG: mannitol dehydrogenase family protein [Marmoricola sp.]